LSQKIGSWRWRPEPDDLGQKCVNLRPLIMSPTEDPKSQTFHF